MKYKIYKIITDADDGTDRFKIYIGSTSSSLLKRISRHKARYNKWKISNKDYCSSYEIIKNKWFDFCIIKTFQSNDINEVRKIEGSFIKKYMDDLDYIIVNNKIAGRTPSEYNKDNKEFCKKSFLKWRLNHKEKYNEYMRNYNKKKYNSNIK